MLTRRGLLQKSFVTILFGFLADFSVPWKWVSRSWAQARELLPKGFPKSKIADLNPAEVDNRNLDIDPLDQFGTMGPTDLSVDMSAYRLKVTGEVIRPLTLRYDEILARPSITEDLLLICPGFFANNGRWTGIRLKDLLEEAQPKKEAMFIDIKGHEKEMRIPLENIYRKNIFLAYRVNGEPLPKKHGFPLRLVYADVYGDDWIKYVNEIVVAPMPKPGS
jgi:DMSO/TMAO reductase YedYZ molybdopterin-dependent catalytic subunit